MTRFETQSQKNLVKKPWFWHSVSCHEIGRICKPIFFCVFFLKYDQFSIYFLGYKQIVWMIYFYKVWITLKQNDLSVVFNNLNGQIANKYIFYIMKYNFKI